MPLVIENLTKPGQDPLVYTDVAVRLVANPTQEAAGYVSAADETVLGIWTTRTGDDGAWSLTLVANSLISPANTVYELVTTAVSPLGARDPVTRYISVPDGPGPYVVEDILTELPGDLPAPHAHTAAAVTFVPAGTIAATNVQAALEEVAAEAGGAGEPVATAHMADTADAHDASAVSFVPAGTIASTNVQAAIEEVASESGGEPVASAHLSDAADAHDASAVSVVPTGSIASTDVQAALVELDAEKETPAGAQAKANAAQAAAIAASQPVDSDLTAIAALATTAFGRSLLELANAGAGRTLLALGTAATAATGDFDAAGAAAAAQAASQPLDSDLTAIAALTTTAYGRSLLEAANSVALRTLAGLVIGTDVQAHDAELDALAGLASAADRLPYFTGAGAATLATFTAFARSLVDDADAATARGTLGLGTAATANKVAAGVAGALDATDPTTTDTRTPTDNTVSTAKIVDNAVTLAKMADVATARILGRTTAGTGDPEALTATQVKTLLAIGAADLAFDVATQAELDAAVALLVPLTSRRFARKSADETVNNSSTLQDDDHLTVAVGANEMWVFRVLLHYQSGTTPDIKIGFTVPASSTLLASVLGATTGAGNNNALSRGVAISTGSDTFGGLGAGVTSQIIVTGLLRTAGTAGNLTAQWAQATADPSNTIVLTDSFIEARKVA